ncbi:SixA phosphatase family protein [Flavihumibacter profundi]|uniref:SixA phosphatase family protein n=1 Tax=Flavihumibacter profundi TaxID=2716883 RepID=UPI001CC416B7|nr:phosphoglycerate mutase family protein [Flavihumibacter profundi]MBZ5855721.1 histidine phosphatase family protein [Flavihumibacter profundi]
MYNRIVFFILFLCLTGCSNKYYIVRHAEKVQVTPGMMMSTVNNDLPLTDAGKERAIALQKRLEKEKIRQVFSTHTLRTESTAAPTARYFSCPVQVYTKADSAFIQLLKRLKGNTLIVGHSNTVDDLVNGLTGIRHLSDLPDSAYDNLFIVRKKGKKLTFSQEKYGRPGSN